MVSSDFTVESLSLPQVIAVDWGDTVNCALVSTQGVNSIDWSILAKSRSTLSTPTLTPAGSPSGATMSFTFPTEDAYFGYGGALLLQCVVSYTVGDTTQTHTTRAVVGVKDIYDRVPGVGGEETARGSYGWGDLVNGANWYHGTVTTSDTASHDILTVTCPAGLVCYKLFASAFASGPLYRSWVHTEVIYVTGSSVTSVDVIDNDEAGTTTGVFGAIGVSGNQMIFKCTSNAADGSTVWKASLRFLRHTV